MPTKNPYPKGSLDWQTWEDEHQGEQQGGTTARTVGKENGTLSAQPRMPVTATPTPSTATPTAPKYTGYGDIINMLTARQQTEEQRAEESKRAARLARTHKAVGGIADLGRALSNLYFTTQYAPNAYDPKQGMSPKAQERYDQALSDYEARQERALNYALNKAKYEAADNAAEYERWKDEQAQKNWKDKFEWDKQKEADRNEIYRMRIEVQQGNLDAREAANRIREMEAKGRISHWEAVDEINKINSAGKTVVKKKKDPITGQDIIEETTTTPAQQTAGKSKNGSAKSNFSIHN